MGGGRGKDCIWCHFSGPSALTWNRALPLPESYQFPEEIPAAGKHDPSTPLPSTLPDSQWTTSSTWSLSRSKSWDYPLPEPLTPSSELHTLYILEMNQCRLSDNPLAPCPDRLKCCSSCTSENPIIPQPFLHPLIPLSQI